MFQNFATKAPAGRQAEPSATDAAGQAALLIWRYPNLSEIELARLINLYRQLSALDMALMISDQRLAPKLDRFFNDHSSQLKAPVGRYAIFLGALLAGIAVAVWAVLSGIL